MQPLISIIIPTFNRAHLIAETINSIINQTYTNWECIIVDDGSTDKTNLLVSNYTANDSRFQLHQRPSNRLKGASACRNIGLENASGDYIQFLDSDDLLSTNKLSDQINALKDSEPFSIATCKWGRFNSNAKLDIKQGFNSYKNLNKGIDLLMCFGEFNEFLPQMAYLIPKNSIELSGDWNESLTNNDDGEFYTRVLLNTSKVVFVETCSVFYRENSEDDKLSSLQTNSKIFSAIESWKLIEKHIFKSEGLKQTRYVENAKKYIFDQIKKNHLTIVLSHLLFFRNQILEKVTFNKLIKKLF